MMRALALWAMAIATAIILPLVFPDRYALTLFSQAGIGILFALSYNLLMGGTGLMSFGHAVYFGSGGFAALHLLRLMETDLPWLPVPVLPLFGGVAGLAIAALFGLIATRRGATVFAMITLGFGEVMLMLGHQSDHLFGGEGGIDADRMQGPVWFGLDFADKGQVYGLVMVWLFLCVLAIQRIQQSPMGLMMAAHRENADRLPALGFNPAKIRYRAFCLAGLLAGIAGTLFALLFEIMSAEIFSLEESAHILLMAALGGPAPILGPVLGGIAVTLVRSLAGLWSEAWPLYLAIMMILVLHLAPDGLSGLVRQWSWRKVNPWRLGAALLLSISAITSIELLYRLLLTDPDHPVLDSGIPIDGRSPLVWLILLSCAAGSMMILKRGPGHD